MRLRRVAWLATLAAASLALPMGLCAAMSLAQETESGAEDLTHAAELPENFPVLAREPGEPQIPGLIR